MRALLALVIAATGCNQLLGLDETATTPLPGLDLDNDGIADDVDPCVAAALDGTLDPDNDTIVNASDPCPFDPRGGPDPDGDGDGVPDACDPFPAVAGDRVRCVMAFQSPDLNAHLWQARAGDAAWTTSQGMLAAPAGALSTIVATQGLDGDNVTTIDLLALILVDGGGVPEGEEQVRVLGRASPAAASTDVGCDVWGSSAGSSVAIVESGARSGEVALGVPMAVGSQFRLAVSVTDAAVDPDLRCRYRGVGVDRTITATAPGVGNIGLASASSNTQTWILGLAIYDRDAAIPLN